MGDNRFAVLFVCHANLCRSPMAERLARLALAQRLGEAAGAVTVRSAGTHARPGRPMHPHAAAALAECGAPDGDFVSTELDAGLVAAADLVLTAGRDQRAHCVRLVPAAVRRTFTIRQFTRLVTAAGPVDPPVDAAAGPRLRALVGAAIAARPRVQAVPGAADDLPDPVNGPLAGFRTCAKELWASMGVMTAPLACQPTGGSPPR